MQLAAVEATMICEDSRNAGKSADRVKPPKLDGSTSWALFHHHSEAMANHNNWTICEKAAYLLAVLQGQVADVLHGVRTGAVHKDIIGVLKGC
jgi:hypothetical protein